MVHSTSDLWPLLSSIEGQRPHVADLQTFLKKRLPTYMVPSTFEIVERFPITPAGKIDRKALEKVPARQAERAVLHVRPRTRTELAVADVWRDILDVEQVGARDNFFDLGGHSLMIVQMIHQINATHKVRLGVSDLFQNPTVEQLATVIDSQPPEGRRQPAVVQLQGGGSEIPLYFIYAGPDEFHLARLLGTRRPVFGIEVPWPLKWRQAVENNRAIFVPGHGSVRSSIREGAIRSCGLRALYARWTFFRRARCCRDRPSVANARRPGRYGDHC